MAKDWTKSRCHACGQRSLQRVKQPYEYEISHEGRAPVTIRIPDLDVIACTNPDCHPEDPGETVLIDDDAARRIGVETYRQLGLLTPAEIREKREKLGLSQQEMQELLGLGGNSLSRWENGHIYQARSMDRLLRVFFGVPEGRAFVENLAHGRSRREPNRGKWRYLSEAEQQHFDAPNERDAETPASCLMSAALE